MRSFFDWYSKECSKNEPWLVLGKGPSFDKYTDYDLSKFNLISLNHVVCKLPVKVAHVIDLDVVEACATDIDKNAAFLVLPWVPHTNNKPSHLNLGECIQQNSFLAKLSQENRLLYYNHLPKRRFGNDPLVEVTYFSSEAVISLLSLCEVKTIRTLGIDGGNTYNQAFKHLNDITLLANGRKSFNKQFGQIAKIIMKTGLDLSPLDIDAPIKVYVASTEAQMLAVKVLEYSIQKHASMSVEIIPLHLNQIDISLPKNKTNWPRTPFSFQRFLIPELQQHTSRAIYLDSDMQVFRDIKGLWVMPFNGAQILTVRNADASERQPQFSVMLLDCANLQWSIKEIVSHLDSNYLTYEKLMYEMAVADRVDAVIEAGWNSLEYFDIDKTSLLHYTDMNIQPWISKDNPLGYLWFRDLFEAIDSNFITVEFIKEHITLGYVRPSLMYQVEKRIEDSLLLPKDAVQMDTYYKPPYQDMLYVKNRFSRRKLILKSYLRSIFNNHFFCKIKNIYNHFDRT